MPIVPNASTPSGYAYTSPSEPKPTRVWLAVIVCGVLAAVSVTIIALVILLITQLFASISSLMSNSKSPASGGAIFAVMLCLYNLALFPVVIPVTWGGLALTLGRLRWKRRNEPKPYYIRATLLGAALVGLTTGIFGGMHRLVVTGISAGITGGIIGGVAGFFCAFIFLKISRPAKFIDEVEIETFS